MHFKGQKCSGGKHSKVRLTGLAAGNAFRERLPIFVTGKSHKTKVLQRSKKFVLSIPVPIEKLDVIRAVWGMGSRTWSKAW